jgi:membrane dipeptidase
MVNVSSMFVDGEQAAAYRRRIAALAPQYATLKEKYSSDPLRLDKEANALFDAVPPARTDWRKVVDHVERVMRIAGPGAAGLGSDFDGIPDPPDGLEDVSKLPRLTEELIRRGHSEEDVRGVLGENFLRFFAKVEAVSRALASEPPSTAAIGPAAPAAR